jgi:hypothetical protein
MMLKTCFSRGQPQILIAFATFTVFAPFLSPNAAAQPTLGPATAAPVQIDPAALAPRPSLRLLGLGLRYATPKDWIAQDYPQLNGVLILAPDTKAGIPWRSRILIELSKLALDESPLIDQMSKPKISVLTQGKEWREVKRGLKQHPNGFDYAWMEYTQERDGHRLREWRVLLRVKQSSQAILVTASSARPQWDLDRPAFEQLISSLNLMDR